MDSVRRKHLSLVILRVYLAATMIIHGTTRISVGGVAPFGEFLSEQGFPLGLYLAWGITIFEIAGAVVLAAGYFVPALAVIFAAELIMGIILDHAPEGWFVVGLGRNGMEYSVLLVVSFLAIAFANFGKSEN